MSDDICGHEPVKLRGHHLLCLLTHIGRGYTPEFTENFAAIIVRINIGAQIVLAEGPDDICAVLRDDETCGYQDAGHCRKASAALRDMKALRDINEALGISLQPSMEFTYTENMATSLRQFFVQGTIRKACDGCEWHGLCTDIAAGGYAGTKLFPPESS